MLFRSEFPFRSSELGPGQPPAPPEPKAAAPSAPPPQAPKSTTRAQIVPIASRREVAQPPAPIAEPTPPPAPVVPPPAPASAAIVAPPKPAVEEKTAVVPDKSAKIEKPGKNDKYDKYDKSAKGDKTDKTDKADKAAKSESPAPKTAPLPAKAEKATQPAVAALDVEVPATRSGKGVKLLLAAVASIALFVGLFVYPGFLRNNSKAPAPTAQTSNQLQLRVERAKIGRAHV